MALDHSTFFPLIFFARHPVSDVARSQDRTVTATADHGNGKNLEAATRRSPASILVCRDQVLAATERLPLLANCRSAAFAFDVFACHDVQPAIARASRACLYSG
ncbi:hypothetical protein BC361_23580 [Ensifer sp. LC54]|nr:hypothetical protein BC361_23580 [Ensifer sp. LC54]